MLTFSGQSSRSGKGHELKCLYILESNQIKFIYIALCTSDNISKCCTETQPKTPNSKQCRCRSTVARKNSLERPKPRKKPREEPGFEGWPVLFWLCRVEIITEHGRYFQTFIDDQQGQIIIITVVVVRVQQVSTSGVNVSWLFIADH